MGRQRPEPARSVAAPAAMAPPLRAASHPRAAQPLRRLPSSRPPLTPLRHHSTQPRRIALGQTLVRRRPRPRAARWRPPRRASDPGADHRAAQTSESQFAAWRVPDQEPDARSSRRRSRSGRLPRSHKTPTPPRQERRAKARGVGVFDGASSRQLSSNPRADRARPPRGSCHAPAASAACAESSRVAVEPTPGAHGRAPPRGWASVADAIAARQRARASPCKKPGAVRRSIRPPGAESSIRRVCEYSASSDSVPNVRSSAVK